MDPTELGKKYGKKNLRLSPLVEHMSKLKYQYKTQIFTPPTTFRICKYCKTEIYNQLDHIMCPRRYGTK